MPVPGSSLSSGGIVLAETVSVIIPTYGDRQTWDAVAAGAIKSLTQQVRLPDEVVRIHSDSLYRARNLGAAQASCDWLAFLDADDQYDPHFLSEMMRVPCAGLRQPAVQYVDQDGGALTEPLVLPPTPLLQQNYLIIGTMIRRKLFLKLGGFDDYPIYEDWTLWIKAWINGTKVTPVPSAVYRAYQRNNSRNRQLDLATTVLNEVVAKYRPLALRRKLIR